MVKKKNSTVRLLYRHNLIMKSEVKLIFRKYQSLSHMKSVNQKYKISWLKSTCYPISFPWGTVTDDSRRATKSSCRSWSHRWPRTTQAKFLPGETQMNGTVSFLLLPLSFNSPGKGPVIDRKCPFSFLHCVTLCDSESGTRTVKFTLWDSQSGTRKVLTAGKAPSFHLLQPRASAKDSHAVRIRSRSRCKSVPFTSKKNQSHW